MEKKETLVQCMLWYASLELIQKKREYTCSARFHELKAGLSIEITR